MYIPTTFFSSQGACIVASTNTISGSGLVTSGSFVSASVLYQYYKFETADYTDPTYQSFTASLNILSGSTGQAKLLIVGAGGAGGTGNNVIGRPAANFATGGGGGGGVVYYNNFPITSGSYEISVAGATTQISAEATGSNGRNSYIKLPNNIIYTPFTSSFLTAYGGGGGGFGVIDGVNPFNRCFLFRGSRGATTGGIGLYTSQCGARDADATLYTNQNGITLGPQGFKGGDIQSSTAGAFVGSGGGGSATVGQTVTTDMISFGINASNGGSGLQFNLTGTSFYVSPGGGGQAGGDTGTTGTGGNTYGRGGQGERDGNTGQINFGFGGVVIIVWPICLADSDNCREYVIRGGASGGTMTYLPCDSQTLTTTTIDFAYTGSACLYKAGGYPTTTGTVTLIETGSCNTFIPIAPSVTCTTGSKTPVNVYDWSLSGICYPTVEGCQRLFYPQQTLNYVDVNAVSQSIQVGGWFTGTGQVCARTQPTPTITAGTVTNSGLICGFYCSGSI